jgi:hypothetical protein
MGDAVHTVSEYFGPKLVSVGHRRISFADAWRDPQLRKRAARAAQRATNAKLREIRKDPSRGELDQLSLINRLLLGLLMENDIG